MALDPALAHSQRSLSENRLHSAANKKIRRSPCWVAWFEVAISVLTFFWNDGFPCNFVRRETQPTRLCSHFAIRPGCAHIERAGSGGWWPSSKMHGFPGVCRCRQYQQMSQAVLYLQCTRSHETNSTNALPRVETIPRKKSRDVQQDRCRSRS